ncbi:MAG: alpha-L-fucosidase [Verrucomicrobiota bacterium]
MRSIFKVLAPAALVCGSVSAQPFVHQVAYDPAKDSPSEIISKAANLVPSSRQLEFLQLGFTAFIHFGINTYTGAEWGSGKEAAELFNPGDTFDPDQWCSVAKEAGMKMMVITVKHHDGFCLWQSRYNDTFSVRAIPWRNGKGDVLRALTDACRKRGLKLGIYLSPADLYQIESPGGYYGNGSKYVSSVIPTQPASFSSEPTKVRADKPSNAPVFTLEADDYNRYFMNQLYELLTEYGPVHEVWFDGATPKSKGGQAYTKTEWFKLIRTLAPNAVIFGGPDVRWCGNEAGKTRDNEWNVLPVANELAAGDDRTQPDLGSDSRLTSKSYDEGGRKHEPTLLNYLVPEINTSIRAGWFWRNEHEQAVRTADDVFDIYERATGGNGVFLLNVPPDRHGRFADRDVAVLKETGRRIRSTYGDLSRMEGVTSDQPALVDGKADTIWQTPGKQVEATFRFSSARRINRFVIGEAVGTVGERVNQHALDAWIDGGWREIASAGNIGFKRILRFPSVETDRFRLRILESRLPAAISGIAFHYYDQPLPSLTREQDAAGNVTLVGPKTQSFSWKPHGQADTSSSFSIHYTVDGSLPTSQSPVFEKRIALPEGGTVKAAAFSNGKSGPVLEARIGIASTDWSVKEVSSEHAGYEGSNAIDGKADTQWHTDWEVKAAVHPYTLVVDTGKTRTVSGFTYLPRQDKRVPDGMVETGEFSLSPDGRQWGKPEPFRFGNLLNDPARRIHLFNKPIANVRYFRFVSKTGAAGKPYAGAAEIGLLGN